MKFDRIKLLVRVLLGLSAGLHGAAFLTIAWLWGKIIVSEFRMRQRLLELSDLEREQVKDLLKTRTPALEIHGSIVLTLLVFGLHTWVFVTLGRLVSTSPGFKPVHRSRAFLEQLMVLFLCLFGIELFAVLLGVSVKMEVSNVSEGTSVSEGISKWIDFFLPVFYGPSTLLLALLCWLLGRVTVRAEELEQESSLTI